MFGWGEASDDSVLDKKIPRTAHINTFLDRHPFHPYDPELDNQPEHACHTPNVDFGKCMNGLPDELLTYQKHVQCFDRKVTLMKCLTRLKRQNKQEEEKAS
eukprot:TRINITY_DN11282_c0_g1_i1.p1 TRINITY_DN11282_c0_g1~~TRINITY_DN11282_c0_g1_i1.p1  ORF type:complete len:101 (+),score=12.26 TRINITY_DN11282_c0_g1_i1:45-347(+)